MRMRVGVLLPGLSSLGSPASGVVALAKATADALETLGDVEVVRLSPWQHAGPLKLDLIHAFGGPDGFVGGPALTSVPWILSPIHDSRTAAWKYRLSVRAGHVHRRVSTVPAQKHLLYQQVARLTVLSEDERRRIIRACGVPPEKISVVNAAVESPSVVTPSDKLRVAAQFHLPEQFALAVCDYGAPRKNILRLVRAAKAIDLPLVLGGYAHESKTSSEVASLAAASNAVRLIGPVPRADLPALMTLAKVYCQPSLEEGAGMAAMEAATYGCTVLASDVGGTRDHLGPAAIYVDPLNSSSIAKGLSAANELGRSDIVGQFVLENRTWPSVIEQLLAAYRCVTGDL